jgi:hypothetical protein
LVNVEDSTMSLSDWFGVLFINVFGTWNGSFGVNTAAGNPIAKTGVKGAGIAGASAAPAVFGFNPATAASATTPSDFTPVQIAGATVPVPNELVPAVIAAQNIKAKAKTPTPALTAAGHTNWALIVISSGLFVAYVVGDRMYDRRNR